MSKSKSAPERIYEEGNINASATRETNLQRITPCLWFDTQAEEAVEFYLGIFKGSKITKISRYGKEGRDIHKHEPGSVMTIVKVTLDGGQLITASITKDGVEELDLSEGDPVTVLIKSTDVMLAVE